MRGIFHKLALKGYRMGWLSFSEAKCLIRTMRAHSMALIHGQNAPVVPKTIARKLRPVLLWALFRVGVETPGIFVLGLLCVPAAAAFALYQVARSLLGWGASYISAMG